MEMRKDIKVLAMHLPQYHAIPENDAWWGKGFTDWVNVKKARPIYKGHKQPVIPLNNNYYDMTNASTLQWQADLAKKYGVYGFCYYHYWFNGKMLLEKPCEILLQHPEIDEHYCFCWANESWARTWDGKNTDILIKQEFGGQDDWKKHIDYLIQFFEDPRYIRIENRPVVFFYSCARITQFNEMISYWNEVLAEHEIPEIYVVEFVNSFNSGKNDIYSDVLVEFEPHCATRYAISNIMKAKRVLCKKLGLTDFLSYDYVWKRLLKYKEDYGGKKLWRGAFVGFDNSPRKGKKGMIIKGSNPKKFYCYMKQLLNDTSRNYDDNFVVVNAWNEWAEGAILEPTEQYKYDYLNAIRKLVSGQEHAV